MNKKSIIIICTIIIIVSGLGFFSLIQRSKNTETIRIYIPSGSDYSAVKDTLEVHNCLPNQYAFDILSRIKNYPNHIKGGSYVISPQTTVIPLFKKLYGGQQDPIKLTIGKFRKIDQLCDYLSTKLEVSSTSIKSVLICDSSLVWFIPNTYEVYWTVSATGLLNRMQREWTLFWNKERMQKCEALNMTPKEVMTLASIIEEETNQNGEKSLIASVYLNRLRKGMLLQADPTVKYAVGDFTIQRILKEHTNIDNPYNTYKYKGLPPSVICTPSIASIDAVLQNRATNFYYFCAKEDFSGFHNFASTLQQHSQNAQRFHKALNQRGIK